MKLFKFRQVALLAVAALAMVTAFQNCSGLSFEATELASERVISSNSSPSSLCKFNGEVVAEGAFVKAYLSSNSNCHLSESRVCQNGSLSGSYSYASCTNGGEAACIFDGRTIPSGQSVKAFLASSAPAGSSCVLETRSCNSGVLSGSYAYSSCSVAQPAACIFNGQTIASGTSITAYASSSGTSCSPISRSCTNGTLSGSGEFASCTVNAPASCVFNGRTIAHGASVSAYSTAMSPTDSCSAYYERRTCNNGVLSGSFVNPSCTYSYYDWRVNAAVFGPCGGPGGRPGTAASRDPAISCSQSNVGQELYENICGSGTTQPWVCKYVTQTVN